MNFVFIMTDTQNKSMVGAYGNPAVDTPNLDRLAAEGVCFENAYTSCPLCTPARGAMLTGLHPQVNGAWANNVAPSRQVAMLGEIFRNDDWRAGYTGKWHLSGTAYLDNGEPAGGFEPDWWYDGKCYAEDIGDEQFAQRRECDTADELREAGFTRENLWGHRVADRAEDFLKNVGDDDFILVTSFDEPHGPHVAPPEYWESFRMEEIPRRPNFGVLSDDVPRLQQVAAEDWRVTPEDWSSYREHLQHHYACNSYIDREIGRVIDAVDRFHPDDTVIIYTSDHGGMQGSHSQHFKGPMMYEEIANIPFIVRTPGGPHGDVSHSVVSHLDILPTMLDLAGMEIPECLHGYSLRPILCDPETSVREAAMINFHRFAINHDMKGGFYPIRCMTDGRYKLSINLFESDEFYDLQEDPWELENRIDDEQLAPERDRLHDMLLDRLDEIRDPFRTFRWGDRAWRSVREETYAEGPNRPIPHGFPFQSMPPGW